MLDMAGSRFRRGRDAHEIAAILSDADIVPPLMPRVQMTDDARPPGEAALHISGAWNFQKIVAYNLRAAIIARASDGTAETIKR